MYTCRYGCLPQVAVDQVTRDTKNAWRNVSKKAGSQQQAPNNLEASPRQLGEGENSGNENQITDFCIRGTQS